MRRDQVLAELRTRIAQAGAQGGAQSGTAAPRDRAVLPFGVAVLDAHLPEGGLALGALHEFAGGEGDADHDAAATLFVAGLLARLSGPLLWVLKARDLFAPGLAGAGLHPDRVIYAETGTEADVLRAMEEGLRHGGLAAVVGELSRLPLAASRRLHLAAEAAGLPALALRRWHRAEPNAAATRWTVAAVPSRDAGDAGAVWRLDRARWRVALTRCRGGAPMEWVLEACDAQGCLAVPADLADRPAAARPAPRQAREERRRRRAAVG